MLIYIDYDFMNWNKYINVERTNKYMANGVKQTEKNYIVATVKERYTGAYPVALTIRPHYTHKKGDLDNFRMKGLIDGLVTAGVIENDNLTKIDKIILEPIFDNIQGVEVEITESNNNRGNRLEEYINNLTDAEKEKLRKYINERKNNGGN